MRALQYRRSIPRYVLLKFLGPRLRRLYTSSVSPLSLRDVTEPELPTPQWVRIAPRLAGICGSDLGTICAKNSPYLAPVTSLPFVMGHELVGRVTEIGRDVTDIHVGDRVVLHPALGCKARGITPMCEACRANRDALCRNVRRGDVSSGIQTGFCRDTGGAFGESLVAHKSQVYSVPEDISDEAAVLCEPFACALHGALQVALTKDDTALVIGCGSIGLLTVAALRASGCQARIVVAAKYDHQKEHALALGADEVLESGGGVARRYAVWAKSLDAEVCDPELGKPLVLGGASAVFDCVATSSTLDDGLRFTKSGGTFVLVGMPGLPSGVDWTPMWYQETTLKAAYAYGPENLGGVERDTFDIALERLHEWGPKLEPLVGTPFELADYREALRCALTTGRSRSVKTVFIVNDRG